MALFGGNGRRSSNWDKLNAQDASETLRNRDVYSDQQLDRSSIGQEKSPTSRIIFSIVLTVLLMFIFWMIYSGIQHVVSDDFLSNGFVTPEGDRLSYYFHVFTFRKVILTLAVGVIVFAFFYTILMRNLDAQNTLYTTKDINQYHNDQHIALPEEIQRKFDWFPDVGATSDVQFSSMISHVALANKGLKTIDVAKRAPQDVVDEDGEVVLYKGEVVRDDDTGEPELEQKPMIDVEFMNALFDASGLPQNSGKNHFRKFYDATRIPYNPDGSDRDKLGKFETVADLINKDWEFPYYEPQRPGGAYLVDTAPVA